MVPSQSLDASEIRIAEDRKSVGARIIYEAIKRDAEDELARTTTGLAWSGLAAGISMGICLLGDGLIRSHLPDAGWAPLISKFGYSLGFVVVILGRQQLFTENTLSPILPLLDRHSSVRLLHVARLWGTVLVANLFGAAIFAIATAHAAAFDEAARAAFYSISTEAYQQPVKHQFVSGIYAGWLVALILWLMPAVPQTRLWVVLGLTYLIGIGGFAHVIAGSVEVFYLAALGTISVLDAIAYFVVPALLGNILGGVGLVAVLNYAQVAAGTDRKRRPKKK